LGDAFQGAPATTGFLPMSGLFSSAECPAWAADGMSDLPVPHVLGEALLQSIAARGGVKRYPAHAVIITEGDTSDQLFIILTGRVKVYTGNEEGKELVIAVHGPGEYIGELALDRGARSASVMTLEPSTFAVVTGATLRDFVATHPDFALSLIQKLIWRVRQATGSMKSLGLDDVYARVVRLLLESSDPQGDHRVVRERMTQRDIAERVGSSREMVSRILKDLAAGGYVSIEAGRITILKKPPPGW
jgi:CRP/FNR family cyclic AMP-dependent transcriptional regulator